MNKVINMISLMALLILTIGCSFTAEKTNPIRSHSESTKILGQQWSEGHQLVTDGKKLIKKAKEQIETGNNNLAKGLKMVAEGEAKMEASEAEFERLFGQNSATKE